MAAASPDSYLVLRRPCAAELREKGSRFAAFLEPVSGLEEARAFRERLEAEHRNTSHHCWAERLGWPAVEHSSDAGEPKGTAGEPIARVLRARGLSDVCAVVVRWFGGVKLGKGGLARAYSGVVVAALETARVERRFPMIALRLRMPYDRVGAVQRLARAHRAEWLDERYGALVESTLRSRRDAESALRSALADLRVEVVSEPEDRS